MKLTTNILSTNSAARHGARSSNDAVALVITLLMLSVITFLAIAFLAITKRDRSAVTATLDVDNAKFMSEAAQARAQAEIIARMMANNNILSYDYSASHNYINLAGFNPLDPGDPANVNYTYLLSPPAAPLTPLNPDQAAQNIANLFWDPRPPVYVPTNGNLTQPAYDFRYWVDINRNGMFESNGIGEPEWIGVLKYPWTHHSPANPFIGRYAYMVLPIGKTLDFNYIHNWAKGPANATWGSQYDEFNRDQGVGSWELNLAALLNDINMNMYQNPPGDGAYQYIPGNSYNVGNCFDDALQFVTFRYLGYSGTIYPQTLNNSVNPMAISNMLHIDEYASVLYTNSSPLTYPYDYLGNQQGSGEPPWAGGYNTNMFYDPQDLFDPNKTGLNSANTIKDGGNFATRFAGTNADTNSYDRYTMQRLLSCIGMGSAPEYGVYVYSNGITGAPGTPPTWLRTKVNINYDNSSQIQASAPFTGPYGPTASGPYGPFTPMPTNLTAWAPLNFFTNAADLLLCSQEFPVTNAAGVVLYYNHFGVNGIPVYNSTNSSICYNAHIHRMLQLAANIYECVNPQTNAQLGVQIPHIYRPLFYYTHYPLGGYGIYIIGYTNVGPRDPALGMYTPFYDLTNATAIQAAIPGGKFNLWGIPWIVGTVKGLPSFNKYSLESRISVQRELEFVRAGTGTAVTNQPPIYTNQFYVFTVSNLCGMDGWNPYTNAFPNQLPYSIYASNYITIEITNNTNAGFITNISLFTNPLAFTGWPAWTGTAQSPPTGFITLTTTNPIALPDDYISDKTTNTVYWPNLASYMTNYHGPPTTLTPDFAQSYASHPFLPVHNWTLIVSTHIFYYMYDDNTGQVLDYVNIGPLVTSNLFMTPQQEGLETNDFLTAGASDIGGISAGVQNQINEGISLDNSHEFANSLVGTNPCYGSGTFIFGCPSIPAYVAQGEITWSANDPLVHYTADDLTPPGGFANINSLNNIFSNLVTTPLQNAVGTISPRYDPWPTNPPVVPSQTHGDMLYKDPGIFSANNWEFPTNVFPSIGWLGRVHRGTPWQTVYLKSDNPSGDASPLTAWINNWVDTDDTYPTNDWSILDLFTAVPNDNAARGLLSVNQTNDAAWAAVFAGVTVINNNNVGYTIDPTNDLMDPTVGLMEGAGIGINSVRTNTSNPNLPNTIPDGYFHHIGDILKASALTVKSPFIATAVNPTDEMVERIPQQTLGLLKVGLPQFVIYSWGQSLRPKNLYNGANPALFNLCINYEITGEYMTRTVCHVVSDPTAIAPRIVVDSFNIEPGN